MSSALCGAEQSKAAFMNRIKHSKPRFGIVIPVRLMPTELPGAIDSILEQTIGGRKVNTEGHRDVDLIVVVDDLDPDTRAVLDRYGDRIRWVEGDKRKQAGAVNKGLRMTTGEIVKWVNADDRLLSGSLEAVSQEFDKSPKAEFLYGDILFLDSEERPVAEHLEPSYSSFILLYGHNLFADPACFWRRSLHDRIGMIAEDTQFSLDYEFWVRLVHNKVKVTQLRKKLAAFKVTGDNMSVVNYNAMKLEHYDVMSRYYPQWNLLPKPVRNTVLSTLKFFARVAKRTKSTIQRGPSASNAFSKLMASSNPSQDD